MTEMTERCEPVAFYDTVDNLVDGVQKTFDFSEELSTDMCDVYELVQEKSSILVNIDYAAESIIILRRTGENDEILRFFVGEDFTPELSSNIAQITFESFEGRGNH